jgi:protein HIRA/HIR1
MRRITKVLFSSLLSLLETLGRQRLVSSATKTLSKSPQVLLFLNFLIPLLMVFAKCYNPHIFLRNPDVPVITSNICSVVALGADDRSVSVWQTKSARPLIVAREVFERQIMDLSWCAFFFSCLSPRCITFLNRSWDGLTLYAVSSDGTMGVFAFDKEELDGISPHSAQELYLQKFGFVPPPLPEGYSHHSLPTAVEAQTDATTNPMTRTTPPPSPKAQANAHTSQTGFGHTATINGSGEHVNKLVAKRGNKKRIVPTSLNDVPSASTAAFEKTFSSSSSTGVFGSRHSPVPEPKHRLSNVSSALNDRSLRAYLPDLSSAGMNQTPDGYSVPINNMDHSLATEVPIDSLDTGTVGKGKRKASAADLDDPRPTKPRTLGGDKSREAGVPKVINVASTSMNEIQRTWNATPAQLIPTTLLLTYLCAKVEGTTEDIFEGRNSENFGRSSQGRCLVPGD